MRKPKDVIDAEFIMITDEERMTVDARVLYLQLGIKRDFSLWINYYIESCGAKESIDYRKLKISTKGRPRTDYLITKDLATEITILQRHNKKGGELRKHLIECEKKLKLLQSQNLLR